MKRSLLVLLILMAAPRTAWTTVFVVTPGGDNKVTFVSKAAMESFEGKTNKLSGRIEADPARLADSATVHFEVDLASLDTGIAKRNEHMRQSHLETSKYPKAVFDGITILKPGTLTADRSVPLEVEGTFTLHGVSRRVRMTVHAQYKPSAKGSRIEFQTTFPVALADYQISRPQFLFLKLADVQQVKVRGVALASR